MYKGLVVVMTVLVATEVKPESKFLSAYVDTLLRIMCFPLETQLEITNNLNGSANHSICSVLCPLLVTERSK
jgi:hypothetical protein